MMRCNGLFCFYLLQEQALDESENKKAGYFVPGFFFVAEADKISNLKLIEDLDKILLSIESEVFGT